jgi:hypothetical protein
MAIADTNIYKGLVVQQEADKTKKILIQPSSSSTTATTLTLTTVTTANRTITLPDATDTLVGRTTTDTGADRLQNKELSDDSVKFVDQADTTKKLAFQLSGITTGNTRTITIPDASTTMLGHDTAQTVTNKIVVVASNTITTAASGNLAATELNSALAELQTDIDTRATDADFDAHTADTSVHGVTGDVVGTTDAQDITGKTLLEVDNLQLNGNTIASTDANGDITLTPNGTGAVNVSSNLVVTGNLTVQGTQTILNTSTMEVEDTNIIVNNGGNDASSEGAGLTVERTGTNGSIIYADAAVSKFKLGAAGSEDEVVTLTAAQAISGKLSIAVDNLLLDGNTLSSTDANGNIVLSPNGTGIISIAKDINPSSNDARSIGASSARILDVHTNTVKLYDSSATSTGQLEGATTAPSGDGVDFTLKSGVDKNLGIYTETNGAGGSGDILIQTGGATTTSGNISITASPLASTQGYIQLTSRTIYVTGNMAVEQSNNNVATGADADVVSISRSSLRLTNASLTSVRTLCTNSGAGAVVGGSLLVLTNATGADITIIDQAAGGTAEYRILTGTGANLTLANTASLLLIYDGTTQRWRVIGGSGSGSNTGTVQEVTTVTNADYTATSSDEVIIVTTGNTDRTISLPALIDKKKYIIKKVDSGTGQVIIDADGTDEIDDAVDYTIVSQYEAATIVGDTSASQWWII